MLDRAVYITDDRDLPEEEQRALVIFQGGNGDWYVQVAPRRGITTQGVRLCTSGGASSHCPGLTNAIADAYRAIKVAEKGAPPRPTYSELEEELVAWRTRFPSYHFDGFDLVQSGD